MTDFDVDLFVIGGGSGGVRAARIAAGHGARVMLAEEFRLSLVAQELRTAMPVSAKRLDALWARVMCTG